MGSCGPGLAYQFLPDSPALSPNLLLDLPPETIGKSVSRLCGVPGGEEVGLRGGELRGISSVLYFLHPLTPNPKAS